jgi:predicted MFS family arabinose efflux permease
MQALNRALLIIQILWFSLTRLVINTGFRMVYPFLPIFARGMGVGIEDVTLAITARSFLGLSAPLLGTMSDRLDRKTSMLLGVGIFALGFTTVLVWPVYPAFVFALLLGAVGKILFDPSMQAYLGERVAYRQRGIAIATTEFGWSGAAIIGLPAVGWLLARFGWASPFPVLALCGAIVLLGIWRLVASKADQKPAPSNPASNYHLILTTPAAVGGLLLGVLLSLSNELINIVFGVWLEGEFQVEITTLGIAATVIGLSELAGEGAVAALTDRIGKRKAIGIGCLFVALSSLLLPLIGKNQLGAFIGLFIAFIVFEFTFVSVIPLMTELVIQARATLLASYLASAALGRGLGAFFGPILFQSGLMANAIAATCTALLAAFVLWRFVRVQSEI